MVIMDPISDMLTRIRNTILVGKDEVTFPSSKMKKEIARVLKEQRYILDFEDKKIGAMNFITCRLSETGKPLIEKIERVSKPGRRVYSKKDKIPKVLNGHGLLIVSTPQGVMSGYEARKKGLGGELICKVY